MEGNGYIVKLNRRSDESTDSYIKRNYLVIRNLDNYDIEYLEKMSWLYHSVKFLKCGFSSKLMEKLEKLANNADLDLI